MQLRIPQPCIHQEIMTEYHIVTIPESCSGIDDIDSDGGARSNYHLQRELIHWKVVSGVLHLQLHDVVTSNNDTQYLCDERLS